MLQALIGQGCPVTPGMLARLSPYQNEHMNRFSHDEWRFD
jgi:hypothetical protein